MNKTIKFITILLLIAAAVAAATCFYPAIAGFLGLEEEVSPVHYDDALQYHFISVGQGDASLIVSPDGKSMLIDAGTPDSANSLLAYLKAQGIRKLDYLLLTHPHEDHIGGAELMIRSFRPETVLLSDTCYDTSVFRRTLEAAEKSGSVIVFADSENVFPLGSDASFTLIVPSEADGENLNNDSIMVRVDHKNTSALFTGDAETEEELSILAGKYTDLLDVDLLKVAHHGSSSSSCFAFLSAVTPEKAVISCGKNNEFGHPHGSVLTLLENFGTEIYRTDRDGTVILLSDGNSLFSPP